MKQPLFIPFASDDTWGAKKGDMLDWNNASYVEDQEALARGDQPSGAVWRNDQPFTAALRLVQFERGRSAAHFKWKDAVTGVTYNMFGHYLVEALEHADMVDGVLTGWWGFVKRGANYSIKYGGKV